MPSEPTRFDHPTAPPTAAPDSTAGSSTPVYAASVTARPRLRRRKVPPDSRPRSAASASTKHATPASAKPGAHVALRNAVALVAAADGGATTH
eukprot:365983-Chlamydomonas_euryale.AAC.26